MRFFFLETDSFYKISKTLEKIPSKKQVTIFIEENNDIFQHQRRAKQIKDLLERKQISATFVAKTEKTKKYFEEAELKFEYKYKNKRLKVAHIVYLFFFNIKKFHQALYDKKHYTGYLLFGLEVFILLIVLYMLYALILPSTKLTITANYTMEDIIYNFRYYPSSNSFFPALTNNLSIPYYSGSFEYEHTLSINIANSLNEQTPAKGTITVTNETANEYSIIEGTRFVTTDGLMYTADQAFTIPPAQGEFGRTTVAVTAMSTDIFGNIMGKKGNIKQSTTMHIKNLKESYFLKKIYATADEDFQGGETLSEGFVGEDDILVIQERLKKYIEENKKEILRNKFDVPNGILMHYDDLINYQIQRISTRQAIGDPGPNIEGTIDVEFNFFYVKQTDITKSILQYISQRQTNTQLLVDINMQSLIIYDIKNRQDDNVFIIPTSVSIIRGYNFEKDPNGLKKDIKNEIVGKTAEEVREILMAYPEIGTVDITIRPPWYKQIPTTKSRITFDIDK